MKKSSVNNYDSKPINNFPLNTKIRETLHFKFRDLLKIYIIGEGMRYTLDMKPTKYLTYILNCLQEIKIERHIFEDKDIKCEKCQSRFHHVKNCTLQYSKLRPETTRQYTTNQN